MLLPPPPENFEKKNGYSETHSGAFQPTPEDCPLPENFLAFIPKKKLEVIIKTMIEAKLIASHILLIRDMYI